MSATRLLVLGAIRILQPVHGYDVRRELASWHLEGWMNIQNGSIYSALKTLEKDRFIAGTAHTDGARPERTEYRMTAEGDKEFANLLRSSWWRVQRAAEPLVPALSLLPFMTRAELEGAMKARISQLTAQRDELVFFRSTIRDGASGANGEIPEHVREIADFGLSRIRAELDWSRSLLKRLQAGEYSLAGEGGIVDEHLAGAVTRSAAPTAGD